MLIVIEYRGSTNMPFMCVCLCVCAVLLLFPYFFADTLVAPVETFRGPRGFPSLSRVECKLFAPCVVLDESAPEESTREGIGF